MGRAVLTLLTLMAWVAAGLATTAAMYSHGHRSRGWVGLGVVLGPLAAPLAVTHHRSCRRVYASTEGCPVCD